MSSLNGALRDLVSVDSITLPLAVRHTLLLLPTVFWIFSSHDPPFPSSSSRVAKEEEECVRLEEEDRREARASVHQSTMTCAFMLSVSHRHDSIEP